MIKEFRAYMPAKIFFGAGSVNKLAEEPLPGKKALIVISAGTSMKKFGYLDKLKSVLTKGGYDFVLFDKILPNPIKEHVMEGAEIAKKNGCDMIVALGGGSTIDSGKAIAIMATNPGDYWDYINGGTGKGMPVPNDPLPIIAVTTTAGTGTEADPWTVITNGEEKIGYGYDKTYPAVSVVDPELMLSVPKDMTAYQGFDALFHSTEGYIANIANPVSDALAIKAIELVGKWLPVAIAEPNNIEAREMVAYANTISGMVESYSSCTSEHSMAHAISGVYPKIAHGAALISISVAYYEFLLGKIDDRLAKMAEALGADTRGMSESEAAKAFVDALKDLKEKCCVADCALGKFGADPAKAEYIAQNAYDTMGGLFGLDRTEFKFEDTAEIIRKSM